MNAKSRTILLITFILVAFSIAILSIMKIQQEQEVKIVTDKYFENVKVSYKAVEEKYENYYDSVILYLFNEATFKRAMKDKNIEKLKLLSLSKYTSLRKENTHLLGMKIYTPENDLLLDMNSKVSKAKGGIFVQEVHKMQKLLFTAMDDKKNLIFKSIHPIFYGSEYLGCIELDISAKYILDDMKKYANIKGFMFSETSKDLYYNTEQNMLLLNVIPKSIAHGAEQEIQTRKGETYSTYTFILRNKMSVNVAKLYFFNNTTKQNDMFRGNLKEITIFFASMILLTIIIVAFGVGKSLKTMQSTYDDLYEYTDMIDNNIMIVDTDKEGLISGASKYFCKVSGYTQEELIGKSFMTLKENSIDEKVYAEIDLALQKNGSWSGDLHNADKEGNGYWLHTIIKEKKQDKKFVCYNYVMHNITDRKTSEQLVFVDDLTSLYNRKHFNDVFPRMVNGIKRNGGCINFVVLDVDGFSSYNSSYGFEAGDAALIKISEKLLESLRRPDDYCFRLGGGEFAVLFRSASEEEGYMYTQVLRKNIEMLSIKDETNVRFKVITASFGLASFIYERITEPKEIYKTAYDHLRQAKADGKNKVVYKIV